jgi:hypothetical protein
VTSVPRLFPGKTVVCLGAGPSLTAEDVEACRGRWPVIAINDAVRLAPWADVLYAADSDWWREYEGMPAFEGSKYGIANPNRKKDAWPPDVRVLAFAGYEGLTVDPAGLQAGLRGGQNSGYQAIGLAVHLGATRILLLGYDLEPAADGQTHFFGQHPPRLRKHSPYRLMARSFDMLVEPLAQLGVTVINCSRTTALTCFQRQALEDAIAEAEVAA